MGRKRARAERRRYDREFKEQAVQMLLDGHSAQSITQNLGLSGPNLLYRWKAQIVRAGGQAAETLEARVRQLEEELRRVERERDVLKKALAIFSRGD
jgi:transposase